MTRCPPKCARDLLRYMPGLPQGRITLHRVSRTFRWNGTATKQTRQALSDPTNDLTKALADNGVQFDADTRTIAIT